MAHKALEIDPNLSMAHSVLGDVYRDRYQWEKARESYLHALALNPDDIEANEQYTQMLWRASYFEDALKYSSIAVELDPLSWINLSVHGGLRYASGDRKGGWSDLQRALRINGGRNDFSLRHAVNMAISDGEIERAIELMKVLSQSQRMSTRVPEARKRFDQFIPLLHSREKTLAFLKANQDQSISLGINSSWTTDIFWAAYYGDYEMAEWIMETGTLLDEELSLLDTSWFNYPILNPLHNSEPYKRMVRRIKLDEFWRKNGFPVSCRPIGDDDFACN